MRMQRNGALVAAVLLSAACGGSNGGSVASDDGADGTAQKVDVATNNYAFSPAELHGTPGQKMTIHLTNASGTEHNFTLEDQDIDQDIESGDDADVTVTFPASGQLVFVCEYHESKGMKGTLVTGSGAASPLPSSTSDDSGDSPRY